MSFVNLWLMNVYSDQVFKITAFVMLSGVKESEAFKVIFNKLFRLLNILFKVNPFLESKKYKLKNANILKRLTICDLYT